MSANASSQIVSSKAITLPPLPLPSTVSSVVNGDGQTGSALNSSSGGAQPLPPTTTETARAKQKLRSASHPDLSPSPKKAAVAVSSPSTICSAVDSAYTRANDDPISEPTASASKTTNTQRIEKLESRIDGLQENVDATGARVADISSLVQNMTQEVTETVSPAVAQVNNLGVIVRTHDAQIERLELMCVDHTVAVNERVSRHENGVGERLDKLEEMIQSLMAGGSVGQKRPRVEYALPALPSATTGTSLHGLPSSTATLTPVPHATYGSLSGQSSHTAPRVTQLAHTVPFTQSSHTAPFTHSTHITPFTQPTNTASFSTPATRGYMSASALGSMAPSGRTGTPAFPNRTEILHSDVPTGDVGMGSYNWQSDNQQITARFVALIAMLPVDVARQLVVPGVVRKVGKNALRVRFANVDDAVRFVDAWMAGPITPPQGQADLARVQAFHIVRDDAAFASIVQQPPKI